MEAAKPLYEEMVRRLRADAGVPVETGSFRAEMAVELVNDGPVTILIEKQPVPLPSTGSY